MHLLVTCCSFASGHRPVPLGRRIRANLSTVSKFAALASVAPSTWGIDWRSPCNVNETPDLSAWWFDEKREADSSYKKCCCNAPRVSNFTLFEVPPAAGCHYQAPRLKSWQQKLQNCCKQFCNLVHLSLRSSSQPSCFTLSLQKSKDISWEANLLHDVNIF